MVLSYNSASSGGAKPEASKRGRQVECGLMVLWAMHPWERDARLAHHVLHQHHPAAIVVEVACTRSADELLGARRAYQALYHHSLEEDVAYRARDKPYCNVREQLASSGAGAGAGGELIELA